MNDQERDILASPVRHGGIRMQDPTRVAQKEYENSRWITEELTENIYLQNIHFALSNEDMRARVKEAEQQKEAAYKGKWGDVHSDTTTAEFIKRHLTLASEHGTGAWL